LDDRAIGIEHLADGRRNPGSVHPVERLAKADDSEGAERSGEVLSLQLEPAGVDDSVLRRSSVCLSQHSGIWVQSNDVLEEMGEEQSDGARPATDVEEAPTTIEMEVLGESIGQVRGVGFATLPVVAGSTLEHGFVPDPVFPWVACLSLRHEFSVADVHGDGPPPSTGLERRTIGDCHPRVTTRKGEKLEARVEVNRSGPGSPCPTRRWQGSSTTTP
jgi:hypothetical protein